MIKWRVWAEPYRVARRYVVSEEQTRERTSIPGTRRRTRISIATVIEHPGENDDGATLILTTHVTDESAMSQTAAALQERATVLDAPVVFHLANSTGRVGEEAGLAGELSWQRRRLGPPVEVRAHSLV